MCILYYYNSGYNIKEVDYMKRINRYNEPLQNNLFEINKKFDSFAQALRMTKSVNHFLTSLPTNLLTL